MPVLQVPSSYITDSVGGNGYQLMPPSYESEITTRS